MINLVLDFERSSFKKKVLKFWHFTGQGTQTGPQNKIFLTDMISGTQKLHADQIWRS